MNILLFKWNAVNEGLIKISFENLGHTVFTYYREIVSYEIDTKIMQEMIFKIHKDKINCIFSFDYYPLVASVANAVEIPYISWIYDSPAFSLYSPTRNYSTNYQFTFDKEEYTRLKKIGSNRIFYLPLASSPHFFDTKINQSTSKASDVCFLGSLYSNSEFDSIDFSDQYLKGYVDSLLKVQAFLYGCNLFEEAITDEIATAIINSCNSNIPNGYSISPRWIAAAILERKLSETERSVYLSGCGRNFHLTIYTGSKPSTNINALYHGFAEYESQMPQIFNNAKINLHFTPRNIHSGISLRVFDVLACHGFLLTAWQPEIVELFEEGKELIVFSCEEEMKDKISFFLSHDSERIKIAEKGYEHILSEHTYERRIEKMLTQIKTS